MLWKNSISLIAALLTFKFLENKNSIAKTNSNAEEVSVDAVNETQEDNVREVDNYVEVGMPIEEVNIELGDEGEQGVTESNQTTDADQRILAMIGSDVSQDSVVSRDDSTLVARGEISFNTRCANHPFVIINVSELGVTPDPSQAQLEEKGLVISHGVIFITRTYDVYIKSTDNSQGIGRVSLRAAKPIKFAISRTRGCADPVRDSSDTVTLDVTPKTIYMTR